MHDFSLAAPACCCSACRRPRRVRPDAARISAGLGDLAAIANRALNEIPAKKLFGAQKPPADLEARAIGSYAKGCLAGARRCRSTARPGRSCACRATATGAIPRLIALLEQLAERAKQNDGWNGLLVGDMSQPRGGPMLTGHASHQIGLDADVWLTPMPDRILTGQERETITAPGSWSRTARRMNCQGMDAKPMRGSSSAPHPTRKWPASSSIRRSRQNCADGRPAIAHGLPRCAPITAITIISTSASNARGIAGCKNQWTAATQGRHRLRRGTGLLVGRGSPGGRRSATPNAKPPKPPKPLTLRAFLLNAAPL